MYSFLGFNKLISNRFNRRMEDYSREKKIQREQCFTSHFVCAYANNYQYRWVCLLEGRKGISTLIQFTLF